MGKLRRTALLVNATAGQCGRDPWRFVAIERLNWEPWCMDVRTLAALPGTRPLESSDRERLQRLRQRPLPADLRELAEWMLAHNRKGEQEGVL